MLNRKAYCTTNATHFYAKLSLLFLDLVFSEFTISWYSFLSSSNIFLLSESISVQYARKYVAVLLLPIYFPVFCRLEISSTTIFCSVILLLRSSLCTAELLVRTSPSPSLGCTPWLGISTEHQICSVEDFCLYVYQEYWPVISFLVVFLSRFDIRVMLAL